MDFRISLVFSRSPKIFNFFILFDISGFGGGIALEFLG